MIRSCDAFRSWQVYQTPPIHRSLPRPCASSARHQQSASASAGDGGFAGNRGITTVAIGDTLIRTDRDGQLWLWFSRHDQNRTISAADVLQGKVQQNVLDGRVAIVGTSAPGLLDLRATPLDPIISGVEINAQAIEQLLAGRLLVRPDYALGMEIVLTIASALLLGYLVFRWGARVSAGIGFGSVCLFSLGSLWAFSQGLLLDAVFPIHHEFCCLHLWYRAISTMRRKGNVIGVGKNCTASAGRWKLRLKSSALFCRRKALPDPWITRSRFLRSCVPPKPWAATFMTTSLLTITPWQLPSGMCPAREFRLPCL